MECNLKKLALMLMEQAEKYGDDATVYIGNRDGSGDGKIHYLVGECVIDGVNHCIFKIGPKDLKEGECYPSFDEDDSPHMVEGFDGEQV